MNSLGVRGWAFVAIDQCLAGGRLPASMTAPVLLSNRSLGILAMAAGALGILYAPFHAAAYLATPDGDPPVVPWDGAFRDAFPAAFDFAGPDGVYVTFGRILPLVLVGFIAGLWALRTLQGREPSRFLRGSFYALFATQAVLFLSTIVEFYTPFLELAFLVAFPAMLLGLVSYILYGIASLRAKTLPRNAAWMLIGGAVAVIPLIALFGHIPLAMYGLYAAWIRVGWLETQVPSPLLITDAVPRRA